MASPVNSLPLKPPKSPIISTPSKSLSFTALATEAALGTKSTTLKPRNKLPPTLNTPISATFPGLHSPNGSFLKHEDGLNVNTGGRTPLTPPPAYLDYLKSMSTGGASLPTPSPRLPGSSTSASFSWSFPGGLKSPAHPVPLSSARPGLSSHASASSVESTASDASTVSMSSAASDMTATPAVKATAGSITEDRPANPVPQGEAIAPPPPPLPTTTPVVTSTPIQQSTAVPTSSAPSPYPKRKNPPTPLRRPSLMIPVSTSLGSPTPMTPSTILTGTPSVPASTRTPTTTTTTTTTTATTTSSATPSTARLSASTATPRWTYLPNTHPQHFSVTSASASSPVASTHPFHHGVNVRQVVTRTVTHTHTHTQTHSQTTQTQTQMRRSVVSSPGVVQRLHAKLGGGGGGGPRSPLPQQQNLSAVTVPPTPTSAAEMEMKTETDEKRIEGYGGGANDNNDDGDDDCGDEMKEEENVNVDAHADAKEVAPLVGQVPLSKRRRVE